ncbi:MAG: tail fiber domain-containing protein, partial [Candidatus Pacebacteria bacterium]|nr:tail fiber domain-containing protein [Candidatus Paceibacterota bacterium]
FGGNIGIGTTTPQWLLNQTSATAAQLSLSAGAGVAQWAFRNAGGNLYFATTTVAGTATSSPSALTIMGSNGSVGIGTTSPQSTGSCKTASCKLVVSGSGDTKLVVDSTNGDSAIMLQSSRFSQNPRFEWQVMGAATDATSRLRLNYLGTAILADVMTIVGNGNVGIGTSTPTGRLQILDDGTFTSEETLLQLSYTGSAGIRNMEIKGPTADSLTGAFNFTTGNAFNFRVDSTDSLTIGATGGVTLGSDLTITTLSAAPTSSRYLCVDSTGASLVYAGGSALGTDCDSSSRAIKHDIEGIMSDGLEVARLLAPVSFIYNEDLTNAVQWGFIAEDTALVSPELVTYNSLGEAKNISKLAVTAITVKAIQELDINLLALASSTIATTTTPDMATSTRNAITFANSFWENLFAKVTVWLASAGNGIADLFATTITAETVYAKQLCLTDNSGETCVTKSQLDALLSGSQAPSYTPPVTPPPSDDNGTTTDNGGGDTQEPPVDETPTEEPPAEDPAPESTPDPETTPDPAPEPTPEP